MLGIACFACYAVQIYTKSQSQTLIFLFNPWHVITLAWGIVLTSEYSNFSQIMFLYAVSNIWGPYIGIVFAENDELLLAIEIYSYWIQHIIVAIIAPFTCILWGRYAHNDYLKPHIIICGFQFFTLYMRLFLTPLSAYTFANLNHTLWGIDNDPFRAYFKLGKYYYFWSEFYLWFGSWLWTTITFGVSNLIRPSIFKENLALVEKEKTD